VVGKDRRRNVLAGREPLSADEVPQLARGPGAAPGASPVPANPPDAEPSPSGVPDAAPSRVDAPQAAPIPRSRLRSRPRSYAILVVTAVVVLALDHLTKWLVVNHVQLDTQVPAGSPVTIHYIQNSGAAFGLFPQFTFLYLVVAAIVAGYILLYGPRMGGGLLRLLALGCILGGSVSNGIDRLISGSVVDFIDFHFWLFQIFNVADMSIVGGMLVVVYQLGFRHDSVASE
jgi:signal peptidase II